MGSHIVTRGQVAATGNGMFCPQGRGTRTHTETHTHPIKPETPSPQNSWEHTGQNKTHQDPHDKPTE